MAPQANLTEPIGEAPIFLDALAHASSAASLDRPLLVVGERGSGKELFASRIHFLSPRWEGPYVKVNCAALSDDLLDSELFGHEAGAFTGAQKRHVGRFERANGGTLFLDEIASASLRVQEKLLRVIEYGEFERVGGDKTLTVDVRIVAAANIDLRAASQDGRFRADLLDRLAFDVIKAPPLRTRKEDIPLLAAHFGASIASEIGEGFPGFSPEATRALLTYRWPGNVRELKNAAERSVYRWFADDRSGPIENVVIDPFAEGEALPAAIAGDPNSQHHINGTANEPGPHEDRREHPSGHYDLRQWLDSIEKEAVENALAETGGSQKNAAGLLQLTYHQMRGLVRKHDLS
ncbi:MAG: phage shock protein operon transcriptional activator [Pseudomonadota bacterium]